MRIIWGTSILLLAVAGTHHYDLKSPLDFERYRKQTERSFDDMAHTHEFNPLHANTRGIEPRWQPQDMTIAYIPGGMLPVVTLFNYADSNIGLWASTTEPARIIVNQFYFPGWKVDINGKPAPECPPKKKAITSYCFGANGRLSISLPKSGEYKIHVWYDGVPHAGRRNAIAGIVTLLSFAALWWLCRPRPVKPRTEPQHPLMHRHA
jgi:hypothetical protein